MQIIAKTELMTNQKHATVLSSNKSFDVIQTKDGDSVFFSIGTDDVLYVTRELDQTKTGWRKLDLSSQLSTQFSGSKIRAKQFAVSQNLEAHTFDIILVLTVGETDGAVDWLFLCQNHTNTDEAWEKEITWTRATFDAPDPPKALQISNIYAINVPDPSAPQDKAIHSFFVDTVPDTSTGFVARYAVNPAFTPSWSYHSLPVDLKSSKIVSCLGHRMNDFKVPGIYTLGWTSTEAQLLYVPEYNYFEPEIGARPSRFQNLAKSISTIASAPNQAGYSSLFVAASDGLWYFGPENQRDGAEPKRVVNASTLAVSNLFDHIDEMSASVVAGRTVIWCKNAQKQLFYLSCPQGKEDTPWSWTDAVPILSGVDSFSFFVNRVAGNNIVFAEVGGQDIIRLSQNADTGIWNQHDVVLAPTSVDDMYEITTYTTTITVFQEDAEVPRPDTLQIQAVNPVSVYINDHYYVLDPAIPVTVSTEPNGTVTILQPVTSLTPAYFHVTAEDSHTIIVDPFAKATKRLQEVKTPEEFQDTMIPDEQGGEKPLLPDTTPDQSEFALKQIKALLDAKDNLPENGAVETIPLKLKRIMQKRKEVQKSQISKTEAAQLTAKRLALGPAFSDQGFKCDSVKSREFFEQAVHSGISVLAGDMIGWLKHAFEAVDYFFIDTVQDVWHFVVTIAEKTYTAVLDCAAAVVGALKFVFDKLEIALKDIIAWLGFLFQWPSILRTAHVLENVVYQTTKYCFDSIDEIESKVEEFFVHAETALNEFAHLEDPGKTFGLITKDASQANIADDPQSAWGLHHTTNAINSDSGDLLGTPETRAGNEIESIFEDLMNLVLNEAHYFGDAISQFQDQFLPNLRDKTTLEGAKMLIGILGDLFLKSTRNILVTGLDLIKHLGLLVLQVLRLPLAIPIISPLYKKFIDPGHELTAIGLMSLITAIPGTVAFKALKGRDPFPKNDLTQDLINADSMPAIRKLLYQSQTDANGVQRDDIGLPDLLLALVQLTSFAPIYGSYALDQVKDKGIKDIPKPFVNALGLVCYYWAGAPTLLAIIALPTKWYGFLSMGVSALTSVKGLLDWASGSWFDDIKVYGTVTKWVREAKWPLEPKGAGGAPSAAAESILAVLRWVPVLGYIFDNPQDFSALRLIADTYPGLILQLGNACTIFADESWKEEYSHAVAVVLKPALLAGAVFLGWFDTFVIFSGETNQLAGSIDGKL